MAKVNVATRGTHHAVREAFGGYYELSWRSAYQSGRFQEYRVMRRTTDAAGALRFVTKWGAKVSPETLSEIMAELGAAN